MSGALNAIGANATGILNRTLSVTEGAQSTTEQVGTSAGTQAGLQYDPRQAIAEGLTGGTAGGITTATTAASKAVDAVTGSSPERAADAAAAVGDVLNPAMVGYDRKQQLACTSWTDCKAKPKFKDVPNRTGCP